MSLTSPDKALKIIIVPSILQIVKLSLSWWGIVVKHLGDSCWEWISEQYHHNDGSMCDSNLIMCLQS